MSEGGSLADRMRRLGEDGADPESEAAAIERARAEKKSLADRMKAMEAGDSVADREPAPPQPATKPSPPPSPAASSERSAAPASDALQRAHQSKAGLAARMRGLSGLPDEAEAPGDDEADRDAGLLEAEPTTGKKLADWLLGRFEQEKSTNPVTPIPPLPEGWEELRFQEIDPPFSYLRIRRNTEDSSMLYEAIEPPLSESETKILEFIQDALVRGLNINPEHLDKLDRAEILRRAVRQIIRDYRIRVSDKGQQRVQYYIERDFIGLGPIQVAMLDPGIEDISCDGAGIGLFMFHRDYESIPSNIMFASDPDLDAFVIRLAQKSGKSISISDPILDAALPDGSRLQATLGKEVTQNGSTFTIRRFKPDPFTPIDLVRFGSMSKELLAYFWLLVENGSSLIFSGGTASGKTTGLNAISQFIPPQAKIVSIEDTREVNLPHQNWIKSVTRTGSTSEGTGEIGMFELLEASLRQRPEYILVGEVRGIEASVAFQAMATGHTVYSTMHADSARSVVYRLENDPINVPRLVLQALDVIAIQSQVRYKGKRVRRVKEVVELVGMDPQTRELLTHTTFTWDNTNDTFRYAGRSYLLDSAAEARNWTAENMEKEMADRVRVIEWLLESGTTDMKDVTRVIQDYYRDKDPIIARMEAWQKQASAPPAKETSAHAV